MVLWMGLFKNTTAPQSFGTTIISGEQVWIADHDGLVQQIASQQYCTIMYPLQMEL